ncbi:hypothetical protein GJ744_002101 [Endocarpon pusillum]|uniref:Uncharacterized protein n=1 Tax=Endocarpon pusillum TaxID=364733 RepID=A0A8H7AG37_9EURO|nr:hypothetical protein GJ744_002101 [Endocarpon pusillum]
MVLPHNLPRGYGPQLHVQRLPLGGSPKAPCQCLECAQQYRTENDLQVQPKMYLSRTGVEDAQKLLDEQVATIRANQAFLRRVLLNHGNAIISRWKKANSSKRASAIQNALPDIEVEKWTIFKKLYGPSVVLDEALLRKSCLLPYINLDDLRSDQFKFLSLLHARSQHDLDEWVVFDVNQTKLAWENGWIAVEHCPHAVIMFGAEYGKLVPWNQDQAHRWDIIGFPRAHLVIEAQFILLKLLRDVVEGLLQNVQKESGSDKWTALVECGFRRPGESETWTGLTNQAFTGPPMPNAESLFEIANSRFKMSQDHVWLLQTDPFYMRNEARYILDTQVANTVREKAGKIAYMNFVANRIVLRAFGRVDHWHMIVRECQNFQAVSQKFCSAIQFGQALPFEYQMAIRLLELLLINILREQTKGLKVLLPSLRGFEKCYAKVHFSRPRCDTTATPSLRTWDEWYKNDPLFWVLQLLTGDLRSSLDPAMPFGFLDELMSGKNVDIDRSRVEQQLMDQLSDLGATWELLIAVRSQRPRAQEEFTKENVSQCQESFNRVWLGHSTTSGGRRRGLTPDHMSVLMAGSLLEQLESLPLPSGKRDAVWQQRSDAVHAGLTAFWTKARQWLESDFSKQGCSEEPIKQFLGLVSFDVAPEHLRALEGQRQRILAGPKPKAEPLTTEDTPAQSYWSPSVGEGSSAYLVQLPKVKQKRRANEETKGQLEVQSEQVEDVHPTSSAESDKLSSFTIPVSAETLQIFNGMFPTSSENVEKPKKKGLLDWRRFVGAMTDAGFSASSSSGSAVTFANAHGKIIFHRPHPVAKIDPSMLAWFGKRLNKWFGLDRGDFVCATDTKEGGEDISTAAKENEKEDDQIDGKGKD